VATVLYTALVPLRVYSVIDDWFADIGDVLPLNPAKASTIRLLAEGKIMLAPDGATDTTTPANVLRGTPGLRVGISN
jgi:hypothetical protein